MATKLVVFDLDRTLWPRRVDAELRSPFVRVAGGGVEDARGVAVTTFPEVPATLRRLLEGGYQLAVASRVEDVAGAFQLLRLLDLHDLFSFVEIYPTPKTRHFRQLALHSGLDFRRMLFFDDDARNLRQVASLGVRCRQVPESGVVWDLVRDALSGCPTGKDYI